MVAEIITLEASGGRWTAFENVQVRAHLNEAARQFRLVLALEAGGAGTAWTFKAGTKVTIAANGSPLTVGYVDKYEPGFTAEQARVTVSGRSLSQDMIDSSAVHKTGRFENKTLADIAKDIDPAGLGLTVEGQLDKIPKAQITPGETAFQVLERLARQQGVTLTGGADGKIKASKGDAQRKRHAGGLVEGRNMKEADAVHDWTGRHSKVTVRGQRVIGHGADALEIEAIARDSTVNRNRPLILVVPEDTDRTRAKDRAKHHRDRAAGRSLSASCIVQGFRDEAGEVWEPGRLVWVESPTLQIQQEMLVEGATFEQSNNGGSTTRLDLVDPRAYGGKKGKATKSGASWGQDDSDAKDTTND